MNKLGLLWESQTGRVQQGLEAGQGNTLRSGERDSEKDKGVEINGRLQGTSEPLEANSLITCLKMCVFGVVVL